MFSFSKHKANVPTELEDIEAFKDYLGVSTKELTYLTTHSVRQYAISFVPKRTRGLRIIEKPNDRMKYIQRRILVKLEEIYVPRNSVHGFVKKRGVITNAAAHQTRPFLLNLDLKDFFGSITYNRVNGLLRNLHIDGDVSDAITKLTILKNRLPQGAPTSPILANMISFGLDIAMHKYAKKYHMRYTRFADDISISSFVLPVANFKDGKVSVGKISVQDLSLELVGIIRSAGFELNAEKVWFSDKKLRKEVTGLVVDEFPNVPRKFIRNLRSTLHKISENGFEPTAVDFQVKFKSSKNLKDVTRGRVEWVGQVKGRSDPVFRKLADKYNQLFPDATISIEPTYDEIINRAVWIIDWCEDVDGEVKTAQGTGFFLDGIGLITADHVLMGLPSDKTAEIYHPSDIKTKYKVKRSEIFCPHVDVAKLDHDIPCDQFFSLPGSSGGYRKRDEIIAYGFPRYNTGDQMSEIAGNVTAVSQISGVERISVSAILNPGISGGPILDKRSHVIGMVHKGGTDEIRQLATSVKELKRTLAK